MSQIDQDHRMDYVEFLATDMEATKRFYSALSNHRVDVFISSFADDTEWIVVLPQC